MFEREKLFGNNFNDWFRQLKLVLRVEKKMYVIEHLISPTPTANSAANVLVEWNEVYGAHNEELKSMFEKQAGVEKFDLIQTFHACKQDEAKGKGKGKGKGKDKSCIPKPKNPKPSAKEHPTKNDARHHYKKGLRGARKLEQGALYLYVGNGVRAQVEAIESFDLVLPSGLVIYLDNCHYAPTITRSVVLVSRLVDIGFIQHFTDYGISLSKNDILYYNAIPSNGIYEIDISNLVPNINSIYNASNKRVKHNLDSTYLWYCHLTHLRKKRIEKLQHDGLLKSTDDESFDKCVSCLSGKMTRKSFPHRLERATDLIGLIHTDVCRPLRHVSRQAYPYTLQHNGVSGMRNRTLLDMIRSMMNLTTLSLSFWDYALESATCILSMVPTKKVDKTPYELWYGKVLNLSYLKVWGCEALVKRDTPDKLQQRYVKCIFIGYLKETMGYYFYLSLENKIVVTSEIPIKVKGFEPPHEEEARVHRSARTHRAPERLCLNVEVEEHSLGDLNEPANYEAAILDLESNKWLDAMNAEMQSIKDNQVWRLVDLPPDCKTVGSKWLFKKKTDIDGNVHTYKARLVSNGFTQLYGVDYEETFSPVANIRAIMILIAIVLSILNIPGKYASFKDPFMVLSKQQEAVIRDLMRKLKDVSLKMFAMKDLGEAAFILRIKIYRDRSKRLIRLSQSAYMDKILKRYKMDNSKRGYIFMQERLDLNITQGASTPEEVKRMQNEPYASVVGSIMYAISIKNFNASLSIMFRRNQQIANDERLTVKKGEYLRKLTMTDIEKLYWHHEEKHMFSGMLGSLDCTDWDWFSCPNAFKGWGEKYDGQGGSVKYTDKWAERSEGDGWTKWGDKWDEHFNPNGHGVKKGETWWEGKYGERWNKTWGEGHNGSGKVHKYGKSSSGEHWDTHAQQDTCARPNENVGSTSSSSDRERERERERERRTLQLLFDEDAVDTIKIYLNELQGFSIDILTRAGISVFPSEDPWALIEAAHEVNVINQQHLQLDCQRHEDATELRPWVKFSRNFLWNAGIPIPDDEWTMISMARQNLTDTVKNLGIQLANETIRIARIPLPAIDSMFDGCFSPYCTTDANILKAAAELAREEITLAGICALPNASMWDMI
nr:hypothetical protein [Tanacetum cinerariifolium]